MNNPTTTLITLDYPPERGGVARYLSHLVAEAEGKIQVIVDENHPAITQDGVAGAQFFHKGWPVWKPLIQLCRAEAKLGRTILVSHVFPVGTAAWIAHLFGGAKYVVILHGLDLRLANGWWKRWLLKRICRSAQGVIVNSEATKVELTKRVSGIEAVVLTPGVEQSGYPSREEARQSLSLSPDAKIVVSVARLVPRKGIDVALKAVARVQSEMTTQYIVIGSGDDAERLEGIAQGLNVEVRWLRDIEDAEKRTWLAAADVFLLPVRENENDMEGFGIVYLEAAMAAIPSVAGRSGGASEAVLDHETGILVEPSDEEDVEDAILSILEDEALKKKLGTRARERAVAEFGWGERWKKLERILE
jgi:phosphatidylinositol alpha-1,6-mannosyltransferase